MHGIGLVTPLPRRALGRSVVEVNVAEWMSGGVSRTHARTNVLVLDQDLDLRISERRHRRTPAQTPPRPVGGRAALAGGRAGGHRCRMNGSAPSGGGRSSPGFDTGQVLSPGAWQVPAGRKPGWDWLPPAGASARLDRVPRWLRILFWTPLRDRYAHQWMWFRGGWDVDPPEGSVADSPGGVQHHGRRLGEQAEHGLRLVGCVALDGCRCLLFTQS
jgi:hypothetical protein